MLESIDRSRAVGLRRALIGLAIPMASEATATRLCRAGYRQPRGGRRRRRGARCSRSRTSGRRSPRACTRTSTATARAPSSRGCASSASTSTCATRTCRRRSSSDAPLAGKTVVITGAIADPRSGEKVARPAFQRLCERAGATTASSVSASTDMLICGADVGAAKTAKAEKLGVEVVDQDEIWRC